MTKYKIILNIIMIILATFLFNCSSKKSNAMVDSMGTEIVLNRPVNRIVSTIPSNTEILYSLGLKEKVVGLTKYCAKTCDTAGKVIIGGWTTLDFEKIRDLKPDLIFAFGGLQRKHYNKFREIATTYCFEPITVEDTLQVVLNIGILTKHKKKAKKIVKEQQEILKHIQKKISSVPARKRLKVARVFGTNSKVRTIGKKSFLTDVIRLAGGINLFNNINDNYPQISFQQLSSHDPDVIIVHGEESEAGKKKTAFKNNLQFSRLTAVKKNKVLVYSCDYICHPNADIANTVKMIAEGLYPDLFNDSK